MLSFVTALIKRTLVRDTRQTEEHKTFALLVFLDWFGSCGMGAEGCITKQMPTIHKLSMVNKQIRHRVTREHTLWCFILEDLMFSHKLKRIYHSVICDKMQFAIERLNRKKLLNPYQLMHWICSQMHLLEFSGPNLNVVNMFNNHLLAMLFGPFNLTGPNNNSTMPVPNWTPALSYTFRDVFPQLPAHILDNGLEIFRVTGSLVTGVNFQLNTKVFVRSPNVRKQTLHIDWAVIKKGRGKCVYWGPHDPEPHIHDGCTYHKSMDRRLMPTCPYPAFPGKEHLSAALQSNCIEVMGLTQGDAIAFQIGFQPDDDEDVEVEALFNMHVKIGTSKEPGPDGFFAIYPQDTAMAVGTFTRWENQFKLRLARPDAFNESSAKKARV